MSGEEHVGQMRELFGLDAAACDICGTITPTADLVELDSTSRLAEHNHANHVCPDCMARILSGEMGPEDAMPDEEVRLEQRDW